MACTPYNYITQSLKLMHQTNGALNNKDHTLPQQRHLHWGVLCTLSTNSNQFEKWRWTLSLEYIRRAITSSQRQLVTNEWIRYEPENRPKGWPSIASISNFDSHTRSCIFGDQSMWHASHDTRHVQVAKFIMDDMHYTFLGWTAKRRLNVYTSSTKRVIS